MELFQKLSSSALDPKVPNPKQVDLNKSIKGRFYFINEDVESAVQKSMSAPIQSDGHLLDFYHEIHSNQLNNEN